ncbi:hypothetical protein EP331_03870 [bacterium]|nr:MAG: hypothetical protein EP331_03870 [bacterium]
MITPKRLLFLGFSLLLFATVSTSAQNRISLSVTQNSYVGDLNPITGSFYKPNSVQGQLGFDFGFEHNFDESVYLVVEIGMGKYEGDYSLDSKVDHFQFSSQRTDSLPRFIKGDFLHATIGFNWIYFSGDWYEFYTGVGIGILDFSVKDLEDRNLREIPELRAPNETYPRIITQIPLRLGLQLFTNSRFNVGYELSWVFTNTDYLDNIGQYGELGSDALFKNQIKVRFNLSSK